MNCKYELEAFKFCPHFTLVSEFGIDDADTSKYIKEVLDEDMQSLGITEYDFVFSEDRLQYELHLFDIESTKKLIIASFNYDEPCDMTIQELLNVADCFFALNGGNHYEL